jgi:UDP-glucose 4-epimerase
MKILVTGSQGGIGRPTVKALLEAGHSLRTLDRGALGAGCAWEHLVGDVRDASLVRRAVQGMDAVVHMAAVMSERRGDAEVMFSVNVMGAWNVLMACVEAGVNRLVNFSSLQALGHSSPHHTALYLPLDDWVPRQPASTYQISKHVIEEMCTAYATAHGMTIASLRPTYVFASDPRWEGWRKHMPEEAVARSATIDYWSYVHVLDVVEAVRLALEAPIKGHEAFLLTSDHSHARIPTSELAQKYYPTFPWPNASPEDYTKDNPYRSLIDCRKAKQILGWQPKWSTREAILGE